MVPVAPAADPATRTRLRPSGAMASAACARLYRARGAGRLATKRHGKGRRMDGSLIAQRSGCDPEAIAAREADITGKPQRIEPLAPDDLTGEAKELVDRIRLSAGSSAGS